MQPCDFLCDVENGYLQYFEKQAKIDITKLTIDAVSEVENILIFVCICTSKTSGSFLFLKSYKSHTVI